MKRGPWIGIAVLVTAVLLAPIALTVPAAAHEHVIIGEYEFIVGWREEPAYTNVMNGLDMGIERHLSNGTTVWVLGAEANLTARLSTGPASVTKAIAPQDNRPGWYTFDVIPTRVGTYRLNITGNLAGTSIAFDVALDNVAASSDVEFPVANPTPGDVQNQLSQMSAQIAALQAQLTLVLAVAAISAVVALIGVAASVMLLRRGSAKP